MLLRFRARAILSGISAVSDPLAGWMLLSNNLCSYRWLGSDSAYLIHSVRLSPCVWWKLTRFCVAELSSA